MGARFEVINLYFFPVTNFRMKFFLNIFLVDWRYTEETDLKREKVTKG